eukprot:24807_1
MARGLYMTAALNVYNTIYTFGGWNEAYLTTIQSITLGQPPTTNPTEMATQTPTQITTNPSSYPTLNPSLNPSYPISSNPTNSPFEPSIFEPVININVTINSSNISTTAVINDVKESVNTYMNGLSVNINYTLTVYIIKKRE